ncbi:MAG: hypothetical protein Q9218_003345 [Villophora microphyllina]
MSASSFESLERFKRSDEERYNFMESLVDKNQGLISQLKIANADLSHEITSRRTLQDKVQDAEARLKETQESAASKCFALCLIDGDGYLFDDNLIKQGAVGGSEAAHRLLDSIKRHVQHHEGSMTWKVLVRVYANLEGLLTKYSYIGYHEEGSSLRQFVAGFTQSQPFFDYVDAGQGKERADHKIREQFDLFIDNIQCKHILLGIAHDNGYVPTLDAYKNNPTIASRISLLKPVIKGREYHGLPFEVASFDSVFRKEDLPHDRPSYTKPTRAAPPPKQGRLSPPLPFRKRAWNKDMVTRNPLYPGPVYLNKDNQRVDEDLGTPSEKATTNLISLLRTTKLCNDFQLRGGCENPQCQYAHEPMLDGEELIAFALTARKTPCGGGSKCRSKLCVLGHQCPYSPNCTRRNTCYFKKLHYVDPTIDHEHVDAPTNGTSPTGYDRPMGPMDHW